MTDMFLAMRAQHRRETMRAQWRIEMAASRQLLQTSSILTEDQKMVTSENQKKVYIAYRAFFKGEDARIRERMAIPDIVAQHLQSGQIVVEGLSLMQVADILRELLQRNIFESEVEARLAFPDLFATTLAQQSFLEGDAAKSEGKELNKIALLDNNQDKDHTDESDDRVLLILPTGEPGLLNSASHMMVLIRTLATSQSQTDVVPVPSLYPLYIPYKAQYQILSRTQRLLEECCYAFTRQWLPDLLEQRQWDCPEAIELNTWTIVVVKRLKKLPSHCFGHLGSKPSIPLAKVLMSIHDLRHAAVHRIRTSAKGISEMIRSATRFARALGGSVWEKQLEELQRELDGKIRAMELNKNFLETKHERQLQDIARQRKELDEKEKNSLTTMQKEDKDYCSSIGHLLSRSAKRILAGATDDGLHLAEAEQDLALETAAEMELPLTVGHKLPQQAGLDCCTKAKADAFGDSSPDQHESRSNSKVLEDADLGSSTSSDTTGNPPRGFEPTELETLDVIEEKNTVPQDAESASLVIDSSVRDLGNRLSQETYAALSEAVDSKIGTYGFHSKCRKLSDKRMKKIHDFVRKRTKLNISAYQVRTCFYQS